MKVINKLTRKNLGEGRDRQMGFGFCKKIDDKTVETVSPISPCKDYLNDVVWSEHTGKSITVYGLSYKPHDIKGDIWYFAVKLCPPFYEDKDYDLETQKKPLSENYKNIVKLLNHVEKLLKLETFSKIYKANDDIFILAIPADWCKYTYSISLYSLLVRMGQFYTGVESPDEFLEKYSNNLDIMLWRNAKKKYKELLKTGFKTQNLEELKGGGNVHNNGFCNTKLWSSSKSDTVIL